MKRKKLGEILIDAGVLKPTQLAEALEDQKRYGGRLGTILLERRFITEKQFFHALSSQLQIPAVDFTKSTVPETAIRLVPQELAEKYGVFPVAVKRTAQGNVLVLAMADPTNVAIQDEIRFTTGFKVEPALALESTINYVIRDYYYHHNGRGSYRMDADMDIGPGAPEEDTGAFYQIERQSIGEREEPKILTAPPTEEQDDRPQLTRELKALLKLLAKKGILSPKEYLEEFQDTD